ncbi:SDR family NAD(P)-dependent oxidoreductase [Methylophaga sp.]|uniref:SDR family NAD(P)-dependent oxidoreductase n=1 Tax=Methylophaga sp. TaxID=2024840 RepID=UPI003A8F0034
MDLQLKNKNVVITGGSKGIGRAIVDQFLSEGANVYFCARDEKGVEAVLDEYQTLTENLFGKALDACDSQSISKWLEDIEKIDVLVLNVSALSGDWNQSIEVDLNSTIDTVQAALPHLNTDSAVTYVGSKAASFATPGFESYGAIKSALAHYMKSLSKSVISRGIRVNVVSPGDTFVKGGFWDVIKQNNPEIYQATIESNPMGRLCRPEEVASSVVFLSSPRSSFISGANLYVDGAATNHVQF